MQIRTATLSDLPAVLALYAYAREQMRRTGNPNQWKNTTPTEQTLREDIAKGQLYLLDDGEVQGAFVFFVGADPTYAVIEGEWLSDAEYGVIHRVASAGHVHGLVPTIVAYCAAIQSNLRIDTHADNKIMQKQIARCGFQYCGIIHLANGEPRLAYQKLPE